MAQPTHITVAFGDGIGPEIMEAVLYIMKEADAQLAIHTINIGEELYTKGHPTGIADSAWKTIRQNKVLLKSPVTMPMQGNFRSLNVTLRRGMGLYANVRPCVAYHPFVKTNHPNLNMVVIRENEEDLSNGVEHRQTQGIYQCLKLVSRKGCQRIINYAFDYALRNERKKVTCFSKDNIMRMTDGVFHQVFDEIAARHPSIESEHMNVDMGSARIATNPELFDIVVTSNLYGDIISNVASALSGSVGLSGSAHIGEEYAMFEASHGSAPDIAGEGIANPSGLLHGAIMMLVHIGQPEVATRIHNAWLTTIEEGIHTVDMYNEEFSKQKVGTMDFAEAVVERLYKKPSTFTPIEYRHEQEDHLPLHLHIEPPAHIEEKQLVGVDIFIQWEVPTVDFLAQKIQEYTENASLKLQLISTRGLKIWPDPMYNPGVGDFWRMRFLPLGDKQTTHAQVLSLMQSLISHGVDITKTENLYLYDGEMGFSLAQGQ
ncbi:MAG: NADP-dependent isocitrate dehydrogenase [Rickettsiales bacterium]|jgi:isocitrate dehydrogenase|nr:NADP-dependent isocitrate dehydrogenase [Rickettsiales bacterium]